MNIKGTNSNDNLIGTKDNDLIDGLAGADVMTGKGGNDTYIVDNAGDVVNEISGEGYDTIESSISYILPTNVEELTLTGSNAINGTGNNLANLITGNEGDNIIDGGSGLGANNLYGKGGDDTYLFGSGSRRNFVYESAGVNTIELGAGIGISDLTITRESLDSKTLVISINNHDYIYISNWFTTNDYSEISQVEFADGTIWDAAMLESQISTTPTDGIDYLAGDTGANTLAGLKGNDTYVVNNVGDIINENLNEGEDWVHSSLNYTLPDNVEKLKLTGVNAINGTGNNLRNEIHGNFSNNILDGGTGGAFLDGSLGNDTYIFSLGSGNVRITDIGGVETIKLGKDIKPTDLTVTRGKEQYNIDSIIIKIANNTNDVLDISDWFNTRTVDYIIEKLEFADGTIWDSATFTWLVPNVFVGNA